MDRPIPSGSTEVPGTFGGTALTKHGPRDGRVEPAADQEHSQPLQRTSVLGYRASAKVPFEGRRRPLLLGQRGIAGRVDPQRFEDCGRNTLGAQLGFECHPAAGRVSIALLHPPPGEGDIVHQADADQPIHGGAYDPI